MKVKLEKLKSYKRVAVKVLLDSGAIDLFMNTKLAKEKRLKLEKLKIPLLVRNIDRMVSVGGAITHQMECNIFFKGHVERAQINVYNLEKTEVILDIPWLVAHNHEKDQKKEKVKMTQYLPIYRKKKEETPKEKGPKHVRKMEKRKTVEELVPRKFQKQKRVFEKKELEQMSTRKPQNYAIELKE